MKKNLYKINKLYVHDSAEESIDNFIFAKNDEECYKYLQSNFIGDNKKEIIENKGEISMIDDNYDGYYCQNVFGWELIKENISKEEVQKIIMEIMFEEI